jgi:hypothetical protein
MDEFNFLLTQIGEPENEKFAKSSIGEQWQGL